MKTIEQIQQAILKTHNSTELYALAQEAIDVAKFYAAKLESSRKREEQFKAQIARQAQMITNLENTLWKK